MGAGFYGRQLCYIGYMDISLTPELERFIAEKVASGRYQTASEVVREALRLLIEQGVDTFVEIGPGKVLCGLMRQIDRSQKCLNVADEASLQKTLEQIALKA